MKRSNQYVSGIATLIPQQTFMACTHWVGQSLNGFYLNKCCGVINVFVILLMLENIFGFIVL